MKRMYDCVIALTLLSVAACVDMPSDAEPDSTSETAQHVFDPSPGPTYPTGPGSGPTMPPRLRAEPTEDEAATEAVDEAMSEEEAAAAEALASE